MDGLRRERHYRVAYGRDGLHVGAETRNALLHSRLQEGLKLELMKASSVSGAGTYLMFSSQKQGKAIGRAEEATPLQKVSPWALTDHCCPKPEP